MKRFAVFAVFAASLWAQPDSNAINVIPKADNTPGILKWWGQKKPAGFSVGVDAPAGLTADYKMTWPDTPTSGYLLFDAGTGLLSFDPATGGCIGCVTVTGAQTITGVKTFSPGVILQGTSTVETLQMGAAFAFTVGTDQVELNATALLIGNGTPGEARVALGGFDGVGPVLSYGGRLRLYMIDGTTIKAGIAHGDTAKFESLNGYTIGNTTIVDGSRNAEFSTLTMATGAASGLCWTSDAVGLGSWQTCGGGGSFVTTGTNQAGLTGTKEWNSNHTHNAHILTGTTNSFDIGSGASAFRFVYGQVLNGDQIAVSDPSSAHATFWVHSVPSALSGFRYNLTAGSSILMLQGEVLSTTVHEWRFFGSLVPLSVTGGDGDIGKPTLGCTLCWRNGYFSGDINAANYFASTAFYVGTTGAETTELTAGQLLLKNSGGPTVDGNAFGGFDGVGPVVNYSGRIRSYKLDGVTVKAGIGHADTALWEAINGYSVGGTTVINSARAATLTGLTIPTGASAGFCWTSDAVGVGSWIACPGGGGTFVTTNTNQTALSGTKEWNSLHRFTGGVRVELSSTARNWLPESGSAYVVGTDANPWLEMYANSYNIGNGAGLDLMELNATTVLFSNGTVNQYRSILGGFRGVGPVVSYGGRLDLYKIDGTTIKAGISHTDGALFESINGYSVGGTPVIDSSRNGNFGSFAASGNGNFGGTVFASAITSGGNIQGSGLDVAGGNVLTSTIRIITGGTAGYILTSNASGVGTWQPAAGAFTCTTANNCVAATTNQITGLSGDKTWSGTHGFTSTTNMSAVLPISNNTYTLGSSSLAWSAVRAVSAFIGAQTGNRVESVQTGGVMATSFIDTSGNANVFIYGGQTSSSLPGIVRVSQSGAFRAEMSGITGFDTSVPYRYNGTVGANISCPAGQTIRATQVTGGIIVSGTCAL